VKRLGFVAIAFATVMLAVASNAHASYPGADGRIAFVRGGDIFTINADGSDIRRLTRTADNSNPAWSPDGTRIAFESTRSGSNDIWVMQANGSGLLRVTKAPTGSDTGPTWAPGGGRIAFGRIFSNRDGLYWVRPIAGAKLHLIRAGGFYTDNAWSPDGSAILSRASDGCAGGADGCLVLINPSTGARHEIYSEGFGCFGAFTQQADWGPAGHHVIVALEFDCVDQPDVDLYQLNRDGSNLRLLAQDTPTTRYGPAVFSPHLGTRIAFQKRLGVDRDTNNPGTSYIFTAFANATGQHRLTQGSEPSWQPLHP
jgi:Tol biopolymer transport system component